MNKTGGEIEQDVFDIIVASSLGSIIKGQVYLDGTRPKNPRSEDAVVSFMTGQEGQIQSGVVTINVYVADIDNGSGMLVKDTGRCRYLEGQVNSILRSLKPTDYKFSVKGIIQTFRAVDVEEHFVNAKLKFNLKTF